MKNLIPKISYTYHELSQRKYDKLFLLSLLLCEVVLCIAILNFIPYTEIDWKAYMEEVTTWEQGELDYMNIRGGTGPLVYPAGFLYLYSFFKWITGATVGNDGNDGEDGENGEDGHGKEIFMAQIIFCIIYVMNSAVVLSIYTIVVEKERKKVHTQVQEEEQQQKRNKKNTKKSKKPSSASLSSLLSSSSATKTTGVSTKVANTVWSWRIGMTLMSLSKRMHSIFILRLFNDAPSMFLFYISVYLFLQSRFKTGCLFFSLAVSIKMNVLLFAPGLLLILLQCHSNLRGTVECLSICAIVQFVLGAPFLVSFPVSYIRKAFEFDRVFFYKWTVNWKFLPEDVFVSKPLSLMLLMLHISILTLFAKKWIRAAKNREANGKRAVFIVGGGQQQQQPHLNLKLSQPYIAYTLFVSNFIGIVFARTLHYQFYSWYFHSMPLMLWMTDLPLVTKVTFMGLIEYSFNVFPATPLSSGLLQFAHCATLISLWKTRVPPITCLNDITKKGD